MSDGDALDRLRALTVEHGGEFTLSMTKYGKGYAWEVDFTFPDERDGSVGRGDEDLGAAVKALASYLLARRRK